MLVCGFKLVGDADAINIDQSVVTETFPPERSTGVFATGLSCAAMSLLELALPTISHSHSD
jgi:hypothetical protein